MPLDRSARPTTKYRIPVKRGGKIRDWYPSAPTSVRALERAADNSKPAARIASSGINGNSPVAIGAAPQGRCCVSRAEPDQNWGRNKKPLINGHSHEDRVQPVVGYDIAQRPNENTPSWTPLKASTDSLGALVPDCETTIQVTSYIQPVLVACDRLFNNRYPLGRCGK